VGKEVIPRFDVLELRLDYALASAVFAMAMQPVVKTSGRLAVLRFADGNYLGTSPFVSCSDLVK